MKLACFLIQHVVIVGRESVASLVIENGRLFRQYVEALYDAVAHNGDDVILSEDGDEVKASGRLELIANFVPFTLNTKTLLSAMIKHLERLAMTPGVRDRTEHVLADVRKFITELTYELPHEVNCEGLTVAGLLKAFSLSFEEDDLDVSDLLVNYMRLVREYAGHKTYVLINSRSYFSDDEMGRILQVCLAEQLELLLIDGYARRLLPEERRLTVDEDLCELTADDDMV